MWWFPLFLCWLCTWCESLWNAALHLTHAYVLFTESITPHSHTMSIYTHSLRKSLLVLSCLLRDCLWKQMQVSPADLCWQTHPILVCFSVTVGTLHWLLFLNWDFFGPLMLIRFPHVNDLHNLQVLLSTWATLKDTKSKFTRFFRSN